MTSRTTAEAHRAVLDHVLATAAGAPWIDGLVLRGSAVLAAWCPETARPPADLDFVLRAVPVVPIDPLGPYPYLDTVDAVLFDPEAAHGAGAPELWDPEGAEPRGARVRLPPEGLHWLRDTEPEDAPHDDLLDRLRDVPEAAPGLLLDVEAARHEVLGGYYAPYGDGCGGATGLRLTVPWTVDGLAPGTLRIDFAWDEPLPEPPVFTALPRADGGPPTVLPTASRELSLAWKLLWLLAEGTADGGTARGKDLHDAVLLAEHPATDLDARLLRRVLRRAPHPVGPEDLPHCHVDWQGFPGTAEEWLDRLTRALGGDSAQGRPRGARGSARQRK
ncbi:nucleotidyl transferase AbiEii/AbiGii toxin family protein [Kitasatospora sp. DSM 101779]|uniref:nucleotidyl transferase AbiEii/AbiGii toxin family protein n=1 Tax=Kitasatospora sp. DSM 101779 TaxID=2853165 RepID=UPI0021D9DF62|nr:nucleotidyl transferase AbiEii/AbiGii toxin family protein [Kitasatospora sp. DSM 101779]MCU7825505.1 nucleotidyl transferase AbiEii/AbiGii toxin family protein [Kitasatospora sp. DSM 101779]